MALFIGAASGVGRDGGPALTREDSINAPLPISEREHTQDSDGEASERVRIGMLEGLPSEDGPGIQATVRWGDGVPVVDALLTLHSWNGRHGPPEKEGRSDANGQCNFGEMPPERYFVRSALGSRVHFRHTAGRETRVDIALPRGIRVEGKVTDALGVAVPDAGVLIGSFDDQPASILAISDSHGRFSVSGLQIGQTLLARKDGYTPSPQHLVESSGEVSEVHLVLETGGATVTIHVHDESGSPITDGWVYLRCFGNKTPSAPGNPFAGVRGYSIRQRLDNDGVASFHGVAAGKGNLTIVASGWSAHVEPFHLAGPRDFSQEVVLGRGAIVHGEVRSESGAPVPGAEVSEGIPPYKRSTTTDAIGRYELKHVTVGGARIFVRTISGADNKTLTLVHEEKRRLDFTVAGSVRLHGSYYYEDGTPASGLRLSLVDTALGAGTERTERLAVTNSRGEFVFEECPPREHRLEVRGDRRAAFPCRYDTISPETVPTRITIRKDTVEVARVTGRAVRRNGTPVEGAVVRVSYATVDSNVSVSTVTKSGGIFALGSMATGDYDIEVDIPGTTAFYAGRFTAKAPETDWGEIFVPVMATCDIRVPDAGDSVFMALIPLSGSHRYYMTPTDEHVWSAEVPAGIYRVAGQGLAIAPDREIVVENGQPNIYELPDAAGSQVQIRLLGEAPNEVVTYRVRVFWGGQRWLVKELRWKQRGGAVVRRIRLTPGLYEVHVESSYGGSASTVLKVDEEDTVLELPISR